MAHAGDKTPAVVCAGTQGRRLQHLLLHFRLVSGARASIGRKSKPYLRRRLVRSVAERAKKMVEP